MEVGAIIEIISTLGFPIACVVVMGLFIYKIYIQTTEDNKANMEKVQKRCQEREDKLYAEIAENRKVNNKAIETIALYAERLTHMETSIEEIKTDVVIIKEKMN